MLEVSDLSVLYPGADRPVLDAVCLGAGPGVTAVVGASGSGKSTLFRCIAGYQQPSAGSVVLNGSPVVDSSALGADRRVGVVFQDYRLVTFLTVLENLTLARELRELPRNKARLLDLLDSVGLGGFADRDLSTLSGGQLQRVAIARALAVEPELLLADEPTGALDRDNSDVVARLLHDLGQATQIPVLLATHDLRIATVAPRILELPGNGALLERATQ